MNNTMRIEKKIEEAKKFDTLVKRADYLKNSLASLPEFNHDIDKIISIVPCEDKAWDIDEMTVCIPVKSVLSDTVGISVCHCYWELYEDGEWRKGTTVDSSLTELFDTYNKTPLSVYEWLHKA